MGRAVPPEPHLQHATGVSLKRLTHTLRPLRSVVIAIGERGLQFPLGSTTAVNSGAHGIPWGDSVLGTNTGNVYGGGLARGDWVVNNSAAVGVDSVGPGWSSLYRGAGMADGAYHLTATAERLAVGTTSAYPKYGVYACYRDDSNYVQAWIDPVSGEFVSHVLVGGTDLGWSGTKPLPGGFDPSVPHTITVDKSGSTFAFALDGVTQPSRTAAIDGCQIGLVSEDSKVSFRGVEVAETP